MDEVILQFSLYSYFFKLTFLSKTEMSYKYVCISSKGALVVLAASILLSITTITSGGLSTNFIDNYSYVIFAVVSLHYLSYPLLGLLGEKKMRFKVLLVGIILIFVGFFVTIVTLVILYFKHLNSIAVVGICLVGSFPFSLDMVYFKLM